MGDDAGKRRGQRYAGALRSYLRSIQRFDLLTRSGEHRLAELGQAGAADARRALVEANLRLVVKLAGEYHHPGLQVDDLIAEGNLGLIEAANRFDPDRGVRFASYATWWIHKYLIAAVNRHRAQTSIPSRVPSSPRESSHAPPDPARRPRTRILSFEDFMQDSGDRHLLESVQGDSGPDPEAVAVEADLADALVRILDRMPELERRVLAERFGLPGGSPRTLQEVAEGMGYTRERVRQIEIRALDRARRLIESLRR